MFAGFCSFEVLFMFVYIKLYMKAQERDGRLQVREQCTSCDECGMLISGVASLHNMHGICQKLGMPGFRCLVIGF